MLSLYLISDRYLLYLNKDSFLNEENETLYIVQVTKGKGIDRSFQSHRQERTS